MLGENRTNKINAECFAILFNMLVHWLGKNQSINISFEFLTKWMDIETIKNNNNYNE